MKSQQINSALGVLVADAAALGLQWLYDLERMQQVVATLADNNPCFVTPNPDHFEGKVGYFAHAGKFAGEQSHYGESYLLNLRHLTIHGKYNTQAFQQEFIATFGPGGSFTGYIDTPTRITLQNLHQVDFNAEENTPTKISGANDHQIPALTPVSALCAFYPLTELSEYEIVDAISVTNNNDFAVNSGLYFSRVLQAVLEARTIKSSFSAFTDQVPEEIRDKMSEALTMPPVDLDIAASTLGQSCGLEDSIPLSAYILRNSSSFKQAIEMNILAGGDSCGRAMMIGAIAGAAYGLGAPDGIPQAWLFKLKRHQDIAALIN